MWAPPTLCGPSVLPFEASLDCLYDPPCPADVLCPPPQILTDPFAYETYRQQRVQKKLEEERQSRISLVRKLPKVGGCDEGMGPGVVGWDEGMGPEVGGWDGSVS